MNIVLVNPPVCWKDVYGKFEKVASFQAPIGLPALAAYLLQYGHNIQIIKIYVFGLVKLISLESQLITVETISKGLIITNYFFR